MLNKSLELKDNLLNEATLKAKEEEDKVDELKKALELKEREISESINHFTDKEILNEKLRKIEEELEEKETLVALVEISFEACYQFYSQTLITLPSVFISAVGAYESKTSFRKQIAQKR